MKKYRFIKPFDDEQEWEDDIELLEIGEIYNGDYIPNKWGWTIQESFNAYPENYQEVIDKDVEKQEILDAVNKPLKDSFEDKVTLILDDIKNTLIEKNRKYGDSALNPIRVFSKSSNIEQIKVRLDDKLSRLRTQDIEEDEDVLKDLMGYLVLLRIAVMNNDKT